MRPHAAASGAGAQRTQATGYVGALLELLHQRRADHHPIDVAAQPLRPARGCGCRSRRTPAAARPRARGPGSARTSSGTATFLPVVPVMVTAYTKPWLPAHSCCRRSGSVTGVTICTSASPLGIQRRAQLAALIERQVRHDEAARRRRAARAAASVRRRRPAADSDSSSAGAARCTVAAAPRARRGSSAGSRPGRSAARLARWMVTPSAIGSVNGTPISTTSAAAAIARRCSRNFSRRGKPAVM